MRDWNSGEWENEKRFMNQNQVMYLHFKNLQT